MKIRYIAVVYTVVVLIVLGIFVKKMNETDYKAVDMISINESVKLVEDDIKQGEERYSIEEKRNCEILYFTDEDYESRLNHAMQQGKLLLDYQEQETIKGKIIFNIGN